MPNSLTQLRLPAAADRTGANDRFLHHAEAITITGRSYRLRDRGIRAPAAESPTDAAKPAIPPTGSASKKRSKPSTAATSSEAVAPCQT